MTNENLPINTELSHQLVEEKNTELSHQLVEETNDYQIFKKTDGTFEKRMKYQRFWTSVPETQEQTLLLFQVMNDTDGKIVIPLKEAKGKDIVLKNFYMNPYQSFDEATGESLNGVTTIIEDEKGLFFATSSKSVYYSLKNIIEVFGTPGTSEYKNPIILTVTGKKMDKGEQINVSVKGFK